MKAEIRITQDGKEAQIEANRREFQKQLKEVEFGDERKLK
jgi:hypothetical protein